MKSKSLSFLLFFLTLFFLIVIIFAVFLYDGQKQAHSLLVASSPTQTITSPTPLPNLVIFPNGGETLIKGNSYTLKWQGGDKMVALFLVSVNTTVANSFTVVDKISAVTNTGSYQYTLPQHIKDGTYRFQIGNLNSNLFVIHSSQTTLACGLQDLSSTVSFDSAAGNVYATLQVKNISNEPCLFYGTTYPNLTYTSSLATNVKIVHSGTLSSQAYLLSPQHALYALVHYPNGPQCQSAIKQVPVMFSYSLSYGTLFYFHDSTTRRVFLLTACTAQTDITQVDVSSFSPLKPGA